MLVRNQLITRPNGDILLTWQEDTQGVANLVRERRDTDDGWTECKGARLMMSVPVHEYYEWEKIAGKGCWQDKNFQNFYKAHRPEYKI